jgi:hypothetical protein
MYGGFDSMTYPGDALMRAMWARTNLRVVGFYLSHGTGGGPGVTTAWTTPRARTPSRSTWRFLTDEGWKMLPVYVGQQIVAGSGAAPPGMTFASGNQDGLHATTLAGNAGIERGTTLYLDLELSGWRDPQALAYIDGWFQGVTSSNYRKGLYLPLADLQSLGARYPDAAMWLWDVRLVAPAVFEDTTQRLTPPAPAAWPTIVLPNGSTRQVTAWQFDQVHDDNPQTPQDDTRRLPNGAKWIGVHIALSGGATQFFSPIDFNASLVADTGHPEARGSVAISRSGPAGEPLAAFVEEPRTANATFEAGGQWDPSTFDTIPPADVGAGTYFDAASIAACSRRPGQIDVFGVGIDGNVWTAWRNAFESWPAHPWAINATTPARKGSAVAAVSRALDLIDIFFVNTNHELATNWWSPADMNWGRAAMPISIGTAVAPASNIAAIGQWDDPARLDVAFISWDDAQVHWARWAGSTWDFEAVPALPPASASAGVSAARGGAILHLAAVGLDGRVLHTFRSNLDLGSPGDWSAAVDVGAGIAPRTVAARIVMIDSDVVMVGINKEGILWWALFSGGVWLPSGFDFGNTYSTCGQLDAVASNGAVHVLAIDGLGRAVLRRLRVSTLFGPIPVIVAEALFPLAI